MPTNTGRRSVSVDTSNVVVSRLQPIASRVLLILQNVSTGGQKISVSIGQQAIADQGIVLSPGGTYEESRSEGFDPTNEDIYAVSSAAGGVLSVVERVSNRRVI